MSPHIEHALLVMVTQTTLTGVSKKSSNWMAFEENLKCCGHYQPSGLLTEGQNPLKNIVFLKIPKCGLNLLVVGLHSLNSASTLPTQYFCTFESCCCNHFHCSLKGGTIMNAHSAFTTCK